jgi:beta-xylosidase
MGEQTPSVDEPDWPGYFADPFVLRVADEYYAYGTGTRTREGVFEVLRSADLRVWESQGVCLSPVAEELGDTYWAPEVAVHDDAFWMYYSVGHDIVGHHIRVARSSTPVGPFVDLGVNLTPGERFAIDPHPFRDVDGAWYLYYARDVLDDPRPGTHLAVDRLLDMTSLGGEPTPVLSPNADWQVYARDRSMYGAVYDWHTLEGPTVVRRHDRYWMTYSGGSWEGAGYGVSWATAQTPLGPWMHAPEGAERLLQTTPTLIGPGHSSLTTDRAGGDVIAFHAWNREGTRRQLHLRRIRFDLDRPRVDGPV